MRELGQGPERRFLVRHCKIRSWVKKKEKLSEKSEGNICTIKWGKVLYPTLNSYMENRSSCCNLHYRNLVFVRLEVFFLWNDTIAFSKFPKTLGRHSWQPDAPPRGYVTLLPPIYLGSPEPKWVECDQGFTQKTRCPQWYFAHCRRLHLPHPCYRRGGLCYRR